MSLTPERVRELANLYRLFAEVQYRSDAGDIAAALEGWLRVWELGDAAIQQHGPDSPEGTVTVSATLLRRELLGEEP